MQTFLPYADFHKSAICLDDARLGKQRSEVKQILQAIERPTSWSYHPAVRMWRGYETALAAYGKVVCDVWVDRGNEDNVCNFFYQWDIVDGEITLPWWFGMDAFHSTHRAALLDKMPKHYSRFGWTEKPELKYWWPV